jgi:hypothetical protein
MKYLSWSASQQWHATGVLLRIQSKMKSNDRMILVFEETQIVKQDVCSPGGVRGLQFTITNSRCSHPAIFELRVVLKY